jgi:hypothetical protein
MSMIKWREGTIASIILFEVYTTQGFNSIYTITITSVLIGFNNAQIF